MWNRLDEEYARGDKREPKGGEAKRRATPVPVRVKEGDKCRQHAVAHATQQQYGTGPKKTT